jgi:hypothetical protein
MATAKELHEFFDRLCEEAEYEPREGRWMFRSGGSCCRCTDAAMKVAEAFGGRVVGYYAKNNPAAAIGREVCEGHDFAIVADRFIVDIWAFQVLHFTSQPVFDLEDADERELVRHLYGDAQKWDDVPYENANLLDGDKI